MDEKQRSKLSYCSLHIYYYARYGQLGPVRANKIKINYYLNVLYSVVYDVISIYDVLDIMLNNEANKIKRRPHSNMRPLTFIKH